MKRTVLSLLCLVGFICYTHAADNLRLADLRSMGMGGNEVTQSALFNPSLIAFHNKHSLHINYFNRYMLKELSTLNAGFHYVTDYLPVGVDLFSFGYDAYRETMFRLSCSKQLGEKWFLGISVQYALLQTELFDGTASRLSTDLGSIFRPVDNLLVGMLITNLPSIAILNKEIEVKDFTTYSVQTGFQWRIINSMLIVGSIGTASEHPVMWNIGAEYTVSDTFHIRCGLKSDPLSPTMGIGYDLFHFTVNIATVYHPELGISTGAGLVYSF